MKKKTENWERKTIKVKTYRSDDSFACTRLPLFSFSFFILAIGKFKSGSKSGKRMWWTSVNGMYAPVGLGQRSRWFLLGFGWTTQEFKMKIVGCLIGTDIWRRRYSPLPCSSHLLGLAFFAPVFPCCLWRSSLPIGVGLDVNSGFVTMYTHISPSVRNVVHQQISWFARAVQP